MGEAAISLVQALDELERYDIEDDEEKFQSLISEFVTSRGADNFVFGLLTPPEDFEFPYFISSYPEEWVSRYVGKDYISQDVVITASAQSVTPFSWTALKADAKVTKLQRKILDEASEFGLRSGGSVPVHGPGGAVGCLSITANEDEQAFDSNWGQTRVDLMVLTAFAFQSVLRRHGNNRDLDDLPMLSPRERECLLWTARGKTAWEISEILSVSNETVVTYLKAACRKFKVHSKIQAVVKAVSTGMIVP